MFSLIWSFKGTGIIIAGLAKAREYNLYPTPT
jgi:hypothetical protein